MSATLSIEIDGDGAAFADDPGEELGRILHKLSASIASARFKRGERRLFDINGNRCGTCTLTITPEDEENEEEEDEA